MLATMAASNRAPMERNPVSTRGREQIRDKSVKVGEQPRDPFSDHPPNGIEMLLSFPF